MPSAEAIVAEPLAGLRAEWDGAEWELVDDPGAGSVELVRMISVRLEDGRELGIVAARPAGAGAHDEERVRAMLREETEARAIDDVLVSTEYDHDGLVTRMGAELLVAGSEYPMRLAGDRTDAPEGDAREQRCAMAFRLDGVEGTGTYELLDRRKA